MKALIQSLYTEIRRGILSWRFLFACVGVAGLLWLSCAEYANNSILMILTFLPSEGIGSMLVWGIASMAYTPSLCEELENRYYIHKLLRGNRKVYSIAKILSVFFVAFLTFLIGFMIFILLLCMNHPIIGMDYVPQMDVAYWRITVEGMYGLYFSLVGVQLACLAGCLALVALAVSVYIPNSILVIVTPIVFLYIENIFFYRLFGDSIGMVISLHNTAFASIATQYQGATWYMGYIQMFIVGVISGILFYCGLERRINRG